ncbi:helix-turn-helix domain-containing protein [Streptomyces laurentii]|uniref:helix-turn-helix domain-containing protein n=1 Tax=Streptomyces laurentii TaxID=39478 RepID=UPI00369D6ECB
MNPSAVSFSTTTAECEGDVCRREAGTGRTRTEHVDGLRLCAGCLSRLIASLRALVPLYADCEQALAGAPAPRREKTSGGPLPGMPFNADAADARTGIVATLGSWSGLVAAERAVPAPVRTVPALVDFLVRQSLWLAGHPAIGEFTEEVARVAARARRVARPDRSRRMRIGACVEDRCGGELTAWLRDPDAPELGIIQCDTSPEHTWAGHQWTQLRRALGGAPARPGPSAPNTVPRWLSPADVARLWSTPLGTVYRLASEQRWGRTSRGGRTYYSEADVHACFSRRTAARR